MGLKHLFLIAAGVAALSCVRGAPGGDQRLSQRVPERLGLGTAATPADILRWDIDIDARGAGLPPGQGSGVEGAAEYAARCAACHGARGEGTPVGSQLVRPRDASVRPRRNIASHWPYAPPLFDYIRRTMPPDSAGSLRDSTVYALVAYLLAENGIVPADAVMDARTLPQIEMPSRGRFVRDDRRGGPEVR